MAGSSPRMRGALLRQHESFDLHGIIPADAGSTPGGTGRACSHRDHPRGCGEHWNGIQSMDGWIGSSPRMRGALQPHIQRRPIPGIIPTDAGSTLGCVF